MPMKRFDHVSFPEILNMDSFVLHKKASTPTGDVSLPIGLVGGRTGQNGFNQVLVFPGFHTCYISNYCKVKWDILYVLAAFFFKAGR